MSNNVFIFVCYETTTGLSYANHLREALSRMENMSAFVAEEDIKKGEPQQEIIDETIKGCNYFLVIITYPALNSEEVEREITLVQSLNKVIMPCKEKNVDRSWLSELPVISKLQQIDFENKEELANKVIHAIIEKESIKAIFEFESDPYQVIEDMQKSLSKIGQTLKGKKVGIVGYETIGRNIAEEVKNKSAIVSVSENNPVKLLSARSSGYDTASILDLVKESDLIIGATGRKSIGRAEILSLKNNAILASVSSKRAEIDVDELEKLCTTKNATEIGTWYKLVNGNRVFFLIQGFQKIVFYEISEKLSRKDSFTNSSTP
jgi:hypothetical protein